MLLKIQTQNSKCKHYDVEDFVSLNIKEKDSLNIFSLNIRSLPRHAGELVVFLKSLDTEFDIIVLSEIGRYNLSTVENLFDGYSAYFEPPMSNPKGGIGFFISHKLGNIVRDVDVEFIKTCNCSLCETECVCLSFKCCDISYNVLGIYRHPRGNKSHFLKDVESSLAKLNKKHISFLVGDINIDLLYFDKVDRSLRLCRKRRRTDSCQK